MFDTSFQRSRIYFQTLQILRIFTQMIERTRRDVECLNPHVNPGLPFTKSGYRPSEDATILANWDILWEFYTQKEEYLLKRISNKTEEVKSLRDGVSSCVEDEVKVDAETGITRP